MGECRCTARLIRLTTIMLTALTCLSAPLHGDVISQPDAGFVVKLTAETTAQLAETWRMLVVPAEWWSGDHTCSRDAGNLYIDAEAADVSARSCPDPADAPAGQLRAHVLENAPHHGILRMSGALR